MSKFLKQLFGVKDKDPLSVSDYIKKYYTRDDFIYDTDNRKVSDNLLKLRIERLNKFHKNFIENFPTLTEDERDIAIENFISDEQTRFTRKGLTDYLSEHLIREAVDIYNKSLEQQSITRKELPEDDNGEEDNGKYDNGKDYNEKEGRKAMTEERPPQFSPDELEEFNKSKGGKKTNRRRRRRKTNRRRKISKRKLIKKKPL